MFKIESVTKRHLGPTQYLHSVGETQKNLKGANVSTYFFPALVFPKRVELLSITFMYKNGHSAKTVLTVVGTKKGEVVNAGLEFNLVHQPTALTTTLTFPRPYILLPEQICYFALEEEVDHSGLTLAYRTLE